MNELADLVEVCFAAAALDGLSRDEPLSLARAKRQPRDRFENRLMWMGNLPAAIEPPVGSADNHG